MIDPRPFLIAFVLGLVATAAVLGCARAAAFRPTPREIAACGGDAQRFCSAEIQSGRVLPCLQAHRASLSESCAALLLEKGR